MASDERAIANDTHAAQAAFEAGAAAWDAYARAPGGRLREELILHHLFDRLGQAEGPLRVLDAGAGSGGYALALARAGHHVTLLDYAPAMLDLARSRFAAAGDDVLARAEFHCASVEALPADIAARRFDVLLVHTLLEYIPDPWRVLGALLALLGEQGLVSLVIVNRHSDTLRLGGPKHDPAGALNALQSRLPADGLFTVGRRLLDLEDALTALAEGGMHVVAQHGIRIFAESYSAEELDRAETYAAVMALELAAGGLDPYRQTGRYHHLLAVRSSAPVTWR